MTDQLVCARCQPLEALVVEYEDKLLELGQHISMLEDQLAGRERQLRREGATVVSLQRELSRVREEEPESETIRTVLEHWRRVTGRTKQTKIGMSTSRAQVVRKALKFHTPEELVEALDGLALLPYVGAHGRKAVGDESERYDEVKHALRDEETVDRFISYRRRAVETADSQRMFDTWQRIAALERAYAALVLTAACKREEFAEDELSARRKAINAAMGRAA